MSADAAVIAYGKQLAIYLDHCADYQRSEDPEFFLWNARRAAEAALIMVALSRGGSVEGSGSPKTVGTLLQELKGRKEARLEIAPSVQAAIEGVQKVGNIGSHAGLPDPEMGEMVKAVAPYVQVLVRWVCRELTLPEPLRNELISYSMELEKGGRAALPSRDAVTALQDEVNRLRGLLLGEQKRANQAQAALPALAQQLQKTEAELSRLLGVQVNLNDAGKRVAALTEAAQAQQTALAAKEREIVSLKQELQVAQFKAQGTQKKLDTLQTKHESRSGSGCTTFVLGLISLPVIGVALAAAALWIQFSASPTPGPAPTASGLQATPAMPAEAPPLPAAELVYTSPPPSAPAPTCPDGMRQQPATTLYIGQPKGDRWGWPDPEPFEIAPIAVAAFCIDRRPVSEAELQRVSTSFRFDASSDCDVSGQTHDHRGAATCVQRNEAAGYCQSLGLRLPKIQEWEAVARSEGWNQLSTELPAEWVEDRFPIKLFNRYNPDWGPEDGVYRLGLLADLVNEGSISPHGDVLFFWDQDSPTRRRSNRGFRCARTL